MTSASLPSQTEFDVTIVTLTAVTASSSWPRTDLTVVPVSRSHSSSLPPSEINNKSKKRIALPLSVNSPRLAKLLTSVCKLEHFGLWHRSVLSRNMLTVLTTCNYLFRVGNLHSLYLEHHLITHDQKTFKAKTTSKLLIISSGRTLVIIMTYKNFLHQEVRL